VKQAAWRRVQQVEGEGTKEHLEDLYQLKTPLSTFYLPAIPYNAKYILNLERNPVKSFNIPIKPHLKFM